MITIRKIDAYETWPLRHKVMWPSKPLDFVILSNDNEGIHYGLFERDILVSVISLFINKQEGQFRKFATDGYYQSRGYGTKLLRYLIIEAKKLNIEKLKCNARTSAVEFYQRFGMEICSDIILKNGKEYMIMELAFEQ